MNFLAKFLSQSITRSATQSIIDKAEEEGAKQTDGTRVYQVSFLQWFFRITFAIGVAFALMAYFLGGGVFVAAVFLGLFGGLSLPYLISFHTCWIEYDETGFVRSNFFGIKRRYDWKDVTGVYDDGITVEIEIKGKKHIKLDEIWVNRSKFAEEIIRRWGRKLRREMPEKVFGMSEREIKKSYKSGALKNALIVPDKPEIRKAFGGYKAQHYTICTLSILVAAFACFVSPFVERGDNASPLFFLCTLFNILLMVYSKRLYYRRSDYFTVREKPAADCIEKEMRRWHKLCTIIVVSLAGFVTNLMFFIASVRTTYQEGFDPIDLGIAVFFATVIFVAVIVKFIFFSKEYKNYKVGLVSYIFEQLIYCAGLFFLIYGLTM